MVTQHDLKQFIGTEQYFFHPLVKQFNYTDGVRYFARNAGGHGAYWFLDIVATEFFHHPSRDHDFAAITLKVKDSSAVISMDDGNGRVIWNRAIEFTDCDEGEWKFYLIGNVMLLPSEY